MNINNQFKVIWWVFLLIFSALVLMSRYDYLTSADAQTFDYLIFCLFIVLAFIPFFAEMSLFGLSFKKELEEVQEEMTEALNEIKLILNTTNSNNLYFSSGLPEGQLKQLEKSILAESPKNFTAQHQPVDRLNESLIRLFELRRSLGKELKSIVREHIGESVEFIGTPEAADVLVKNKLIGIPESQAINEIHRITTKALYAEKISAGEVDFCLSVAPGIIKQLRANRRKKGI
ncbi:hypothetical protein LF817_00805 [Halobacillus sp. A1]|uniref:hypothetical protein n=1 Tax=Halobacillus sp. A1 TaxID=2880262 RepID=UPI0020A6C456|nr:hypothetical protein [Halobacillus sp. A1]MCP3029871.1 hypothetical protein [Halobacillus sp. A1]